MPDQPGCTCSICEGDYMNQSVSRDSVGQSADLRTRIAAALFARAMSRLAWHRSWDALQPEVQQTWLDDADAVIRELNLERQDHYDPYCDHYRYVTDWIAP